MAQRGHAQHVQPARGAALGQRRDPDGARRVAVEKAHQRAPVVAAERAQRVEFAPQPLADQQHALGAIEQALAALLRSADHPDAGKHQRHDGGRDGQRNEQFQQGEAAGAALHGGALHHAGR